MLKSHQQSSRLDVLDYFNTTLKNKSRGYTLECFSSFFNTISLKWTFFIKKNQHCSFFPIDWDLPCHFICRFYVLFSSGQFWLLQKLRVDVIENSGQINNLGVFVSIYILNILIINAIHDYIYIFPITKDKWLSKVVDLLIL